MSSVITPDHPRWDEFTALLSEACEFSEDGTKWKCSNSPERERAVAVMREMEEIDIDESLIFFDLHGGHCDCEILFNVEQDCLSD